MTGEPIRDGTPTSNLLLTPPLDPTSARGGSLADRARAQKFATDTSFAAARRSLEKRAEALQTQVDQLRAVEAKDVARRDETVEELQRRQRDLRLELEKYSGLDAAYNDLKQAYAGLVAARTRAVEQHQQLDDRRKQLEAQKIQLARDIQDQVHLRDGQRAQAEAVLAAKREKSKILRAETLHAQETVLSLEREVTARIAAAGGDPGRAAHAPRLAAPTATVPADVALAGPRMRAATPMDFAPTLRSASPPRIEVIRSYRHHSPSPVRS